MGHTKYGPIKDNIKMKITMKDKKEIGKKEKIQNKKDKWERNKEGKRKLLGPAYYQTLRGRTNPIWREYI
jgi:hypothetical protein